MKPGPASILYLTQTFPPEPGATKRPFKQAQALQALGHAVTVVTPFAHYPYGRLEAGDRFRLWKRGRVDGVDVLRVWCFPAPNAGLGRRLLGFASFTLTSIIAGLVLRRRDVIIGSVTTPGMELAALFLAKVKRARSVLEVRDLLPDSWLRVGLVRSERVRRWLFAFYEKVWERAWMVAVSDPASIEPLTKRGARHVVELGHAVDFEDMDAWDRAKSREQLGVSDKFVVIYAGSLNAHYETPTIAEAGVIAAASISDIETIIVGAGTDEPVLRAIQGAAGCRGIRILPPVAPSDVGRILAAADLFILPLWYVGKDALIGTKIAEYFAAGRPTIFCLPPSAVGVSETYGTGFPVPLKDAGALAEAIRAFYNDPEMARRAGLAARSLAETRFDRRMVVTRFSQVLQSALAAPNGT